MQVFYFTRNIGWMHTLVHNQSCLHQFKPLTYQNELRPWILSIKLCFDTKLISNNCQRVMSDIQGLIPPSSGQN